MELKIFPRMSEKAYAQTQDNTYVFEVPKAANKQQIEQAISKQYGVKVVDVNSIIVKGKTKSKYRKGGRPVISKAQDIKKAYVRLAEGEKIAIFDESNESSADVKSAKEKK